GCSNLAVSGRPSSSTGGTGSRNQRTGGTAAVMSACLLSSTVCLRSEKRVVLPGLTDPVARPMGRARRVGHVRRRPPRPTAPRGTRMLGSTVLGKYRLLHPLGSGSNGEVYLAEPLRYPNYRVVVKRILDHVVAHPRFRQLFEAEVRSMANFSHPYAVRFLEASLDDPIGPCLVMEYVPGMTLEALLRRHRRLMPDRIGRLLGYFCHALQAAHDA